MENEGELRIIDSQGELFYADWIGDHWMSLTDHSPDHTRSASLQYRKGADGYTVLAAFFDGDEHVDRLSHYEVDQKDLGGLLTTILTEKFPEFLEGLVEKKGGSENHPYPEPPQPVEISATDRELFGMNAYILPFSRGTYVIQTGIRTNRVARMHVETNGTTDVLYSVREPGGKMVESGGKTKMEETEAKNIIRYLLNVKFPERLEGHSFYAWKRYAVASRRVHNVQERRKDIEIAEVYLSELTRHRPQYNPQV